MPLGRAPGRRGESHVDARPREDGEDGADDRRLAHPGSPRDDQHLPAGGLLDGAPLLGRQLDARLRLEARDGLRRRLAERSAARARRSRPAARASRTSAACISAAKTTRSPPARLDDRATRQEDARLERA